MKTRSEDKIPKKRSEEKLSQKRSDEKTSSTHISSSNSHPSIKKIAKKGVLHKKQLFGKWKEQFYSLENGLLMEYNKMTDSKPKQMYRLEDGKVQSGKDLIGEENTINLIIKHKNPLFLKAATVDSYIEWLSAFSSNCNDDKNLNYDTNLADAFNDPVVITSDTGTIVEVNEAAAELFKYPKNAMIGQHVNIIIPDHIAKIHDNYIEKYLQTKTTHLIGKPRRVPAVTSEGKIIEVLLSLGVENKKERIRFIGTLRKVEPEQLQTNTLENLLNSKVDQFLKGQTMSLYRLETEVSEIKKYLQLLLTNKNIDFNLVSTIQDKSQAINNLFSSTVNNTSPTTSFSFDSPVYDTKKMEMIELIRQVGDSVRISSCIVDGWKCNVKEIDVEKLNLSKVVEYEKEILILKKIPFQKNIERILFHNKTPKTLRIYFTENNVTFSSRLSLMKKENKRLSYEKAVKLCLDIIKGLIFLHEHHITHKDLSTDNLYANFNTSGDISFLTISNYDGSNFLTNDYKFTDSSFYVCAPEVFLTGDFKRFTHASDVWSLGIVLYEMMTNTNPFDQKSYSEIKSLVSGNKFFYNLLEKINDDTFKPLFTTLENVLQMDPNSRNTLLNLKEKFVDLL